MDVVRVVTGSESITLAEAKNFLRMENTTVDDALISDLITSAREQAELICNRSFIEQEITIQMSISDSEIESEMDFPLPYPNHLSVDEVKINGSITSSYKTTGLNKLHVIYKGLTTGETGTALVQIKYTAGDCLESVRTAMKNMIKEMYHNRSDQTIQENAFAWLLPHKYFG
jgi:hypothetical protein